MNDKLQPSNYCDLSVNEKVVAREYVKAILRTELISIIPGKSHQFSSVSIDESLAKMIDEILTYDEQDTHTNKILEEVTHPFKNILRGSVSECIECLLKNKWDRDKCKNQCNIPIKPPDEE